MKTKSDRTESVPRGLRMPAEWQPHAATFLAWPSNPRDWPGKFQPIPWVFAEILRYLSRSETVYLSVCSAQHEARARRTLIRAGVSTERISFLRQPMDRGWMRDVCPAFVVAGPASSRARTLMGIHFGFNGWAKYPDYKRDARLPAAYSRALGFPLTRAESHGRPVILEGGAFDINGCGTLLTTEECLLDPSIQVRNPGFSREDYAEVFRRYLGVTNTVWLGNGIAGDDTHGHVDDLCRFVNPTTVVLCAETKSSDANYISLCENRERIESARLEDGARVTIVSLPMPSPVIFDGMRLPASYANFYIANECVLVPTFNDPNDRIALGTFAELFPTRQVTGIHALDLVWGLGTIHCLTHELPAV